MSQMAKRRRESRVARHARVRKTVVGTPDRPRLAVFRSGKHFYAQIVDDVAGRSLATVSTLTKGVRDEVKGKKKTEASAVVGKKIAEVAKEKKTIAQLPDTRGALAH